MTKEKATVSTEVLEKTNTKENEDIMVIDDRGEDDVLTKTTSQDKIVKENLRVSFGERAETYHRGLSGKKFMPRDKNQKMEDGRRHDVFDPEYVPCPAPVKIQKSGGCNKENLSMCGATSPKSLKGKSLRDWWIVHHEQHWEVWYEMNKRKHGQGKTGLHRSDPRSEAPPGSTHVEYPKWTAKGKEGEMRFDLSDYEKRIEEMRLKADTYE